MENTNDTPIAERATIVIVGDRNAGKSSLMNALFERNVAIVSDRKGTTTDPVLRKSELIGLGPVSIIDTAGLDDSGELGARRVEKTRERLIVSDAVLFATDISKVVSDTEKSYIEEIKKSGKPAIIVATHADKNFDVSKEEYLRHVEFPVVKVTVHNSANTFGIEQLLRAMEDMAQRIRGEIAPLDGLVKEGDVIMLVAPQDLSAPKGRLILPQVETLRDALDKGCATVVLRDIELESVYKSYPRPSLVITDSQAFAHVAEVIDEEQPLTSFSILFARKKGDLKYFNDSLAALSSFPKGGKVLVMEACNHHRRSDDIGTVKIPALFHKKVDSEAVFSVARELPNDIATYSLVIHCAACMATRAAVLARVEKLKELGIPTVNYGLFLAWANGLLPRALKPLMAAESV